MLDHRGYGHWKTRMMQLIRGQGEYAWTAVEDGWEHPFSTTEAGLKVKKQKANWTDKEKNLSKFNARAMNAIYSCIDDDEFNLVQGSENAKQMWDILEKTHEGNTGVKYTRLDQLATDLENLKMDPSETIVQFSSKLSGIANEAKSLGKTYKEKKLVNKMLRCLPPKYAAHKAVMRVSGNTYTLKYEDLVGILKSEEMEGTEYQRNQNKVINFKANEENGPDPLQEIIENLSLMARNFGKALKRVEKVTAHQIHSTSYSITTLDPEVEYPQSSLTRATRPHTRSPHSTLSALRIENSGKSYYHPVRKRKELKCYECNGFGHVKSECPSTQKGKEKSLLSFSESDSYSDGEVEPTLNFVAFSAKDENGSSEDSDLDNDDGKEISDNYKTLYDSWISLSNDKLQLTKENMMLVAQEMAQAMIHGNNILEGFWAEVVSTACYIVNMVYVKPGTKTTPYEIWKRKSPNLSHLRVFGCVCYILNNKEQLGKFASRSDEGIFLGYSTNSSAYKMYNKRTNVIGDAVNVVFDDKSRFMLPPVQDESTAAPATKVIEEPATKIIEASATDETEGVAVEKTDEAEEENELQSSPVTHLHKKLIVHRNHSAADVIRDLNERKTRGVQLDFHEMLQHSCMEEPKTIVATLEDEFWYGACTEELNQFTRNDVWDLVPRPAHINVVGTK
ncbi:Zinc finger CCHC-type [Arabidopsis suecica]|uniref:Zinc finger CCHC-type n=1 Tax=Arabidopsis suecica TaxID=45249 RepID=A0A8T1ZTU4_ARASU|nr:Zinc finger CCHC-type [Arabidopsis suecica]